VAHFDPESLAYFNPDLVAHFNPESLAHFNPESVAHFNPEYPPNSCFSFNVAKANDYFFSFFSCLKATAIDSLQ
jgi:hypothetical protein